MTRFCVTKLHQFLKVSGRRRSLYENALILSWQLQVTALQRQWPRSLLHGINTRFLMQPSNSLRRLFSPTWRIVSPCNENKPNMMDKIPCGDCDPLCWRSWTSTQDPRYWSIEKVMEKAEFSSSALAEHAWKHNHCVHWVDACVLGVESKHQLRLTGEAINIRRLQSFVNKDRGTLQD